MRGAGDFDQDALVAAADLVGRSGAYQFEIGYEVDDVPPDEAGWYATAHFRGHPVKVEGKGPVEAAEGLARLLLRGAQCRRCGKDISLSDDKAGCRWTRQGRTWRPGCGMPINQDIPHLS